MRPALELHLLRGFCFLASQQSLLTIAVKLIPFSFLNTSKIELTPSSGFLGASRSKLLHLVQAVCVRFGTDVSDNYWIYIIQYMREQVKCCKHV